MRSLQSSKIPNPDAQEALPVNSLPFQLLYRKSQGGFPLSHAVPTSAAKGAPLQLFQTPVYQIPATCHAGIPAERLCTRRKGRGPSSVPARLGTRGAVGSQFVSRASTWGAHLCLLQAVLTSGVTDTDSCCHILAATGPSAVAGCGTSSGWLRFPRHAPEAAGLSQAWGPLLTPCLQRPWGTSPTNSPAEVPQDATALQARTGQETAWRKPYSSG